MLDNNGRFLLLRPQIWLKDYSADAGLSCAQIVISKRTCLPGECLSYPFAILSYHFMSTKFSIDHYFYYVAIGLFLHFLLFKLNSLPLLEISVSLLNIYYSCNEICFKSNYTVYLYWKY